MPEPNPSLPSEHSLSAAPLLAITPSPVPAVPFSSPSRHFPSSAAALTPPAAISSSPGSPLPARVIKSSPLRTCSPHLTLGAMPGHPSPPRTPPLPPPIPSLVSKVSSTSLLNNRLPVRYAACSGRNHFARSNARLSHFKQTFLPSATKTRALRPATFPLPTG